MLREIRREPGKQQPPCPPGMAEPVALRHVAGDELEGARAPSVEPCRLAERDAGIDQRRDHHRRSSRPAPCRRGRAAPALDAHAPAACRAAARAAPRRPRCARAACEPVEDVVALEIAAVGDVVVLREKRRVVLARASRRSPRATRRRTCPPRLRESASSEAQNAPSSVVISRASQPRSRCARCAEQRIAGMRA